MTPSQRANVLVTGADLAPQAMALLSDFNVHFAGARPSEADLIQRVKELDPIGIIVRYGKITPQIIDAARSLKVISKHGSGVDTIDVAYATSRGIEVRAAVGSNADAVAEHTLALMLACVKSLVPLHQSMQTGQWLKSQHKSGELKGKTLGLVGCGTIAQLVAKMAQAFGMKVLAFDPYVKSTNSAVPLVDFATICAQCDVISLHCPLTVENRNMINAETLAMMRPGVILINTARGGLIDEAALVEAIEKGQVRAVGVDSYQVEPPPVDHPFVGHAAIIMTPHVGGVSEQAYVNMGVGAARNLVDSL